MCALLLSVWDCTSLGLHVFLILFLKLDNLERRKNYIVTYDEKVCVGKKVVFGVFLHGADSAGARRVVQQIY